MRWVGFWCIALLATLAAVTQAHAAFPYALSGEVPDDLTGKRVWMYASTPEEGASPAVTADARELHGVRGAHLVDAADVDQGWRTTTGRADVTIAVLDSGIKWDDDGAMTDLRFKTRITKGEAEAPQADRAAPSEPGLGDCAAYDAGGAWDLNGDGVFNLRDYACDSRVAIDPARGVNPDMLDPQDVLIAFTDGVDDDGNGHPDDLVGWDFVDDDNDPYDDVQYGHGTGEARDSTAEADNGGELGTCPNCMATHLRVGTSFIADVNRFAQAAIYATDNDVLVIQEALGTLNKSRLGRDAVDYAWEHGVTVIASAADEAAQHNNWPSSYPRVVLVNSVTHSDVEGASTPSYVAFNGCTNFNAKIDLAIPSVSCSSDATGRAAGMAGLVHSAALDARDAGRLEAHPSCERAGGADCALSAGEVKQLLAAGILGDEPVADDVNFAQTPTGQSTELSCSPAPTAACMDPFLAAPTTRLGTSAPRSYPARRGHDQFYGYGRVNMARVLEAADAGRVPPDVEITSPRWYDAIDPGDAAFDVHGTVWARGAAYTCRVLAAPGGYPGEADFRPVDSDVCDGETARSAPLDGTLAAVDVAALRARFPAGTDFAGPEHGAAPQQPHSGRPNSDPYGVVVKVVATLAGEDDLTGQDRRKLFLHRDADTLDGFPKQLAGDGEASPLLADLDGDNRNELIVANSDGVVHAWRRDGSELPGFPVRTDDLPRQTGRAFAGGAIERAAGAVLASPAVGDLDRDGRPELVVADLEGKLYVFGPGGERVRTLASDRAFSGAPLEPFVNVRRGKLNRTQRGFLGSPVLADLDGDDGGRLEIVAASLDRHVYAWHDGGTPVDGWPVLAVDRSKVASVDPATHRVTFKPDVGADHEQGAIVDTPAVGDLDGDGATDVVIGTNESYAGDADGGLNAGGVDEATFGVLGQALSPANGRLFAFDRDGTLKDGWPFRVGILQAGVLPLVGEGITGSPVIGAVPCGDGETAVGAIPAAGLAYLVDASGRSCHGRVNGKDVALASSGGTSTDQPFLAAFGHPAFGSVAGGTAFLAPVAGVQRALDVVLPEYQGGKDGLAAWVPRSGSVRPGWPAEVNDLQFLTGPSVADIDPSVPGEEVVAGTSSMDLQAFSSGGSDVPGWPKLTGDWTVANPTIGTWGAGPEKVVVGLTRSGKVLAYGTGADGCSASSWPRFHHDNANSGDARRDAVPPGRAEGVRLKGARLTFTAPGDDLRCGTADHYEVRTADAPIDGATFADADPVEVSGRRGAAGGEEEALALATGTLRRFVAVRAVDDQDGVGPVATVTGDRGPRGRRATLGTAVGNRVR